MSLKFTKGLCVMTMKNDTKIQEEMTCRFKIDMRNFTKFDSSTRKSKIHIHVKKVGHTSEFTFDIY